MKLRGYNKSIISYIFQGQFVFKLLSTMHGSVVLCMNVTDNILCDVVEMAWKEYHVRGVD